MSAFHEIWIEQCDTALSIRESFGLPKALGYPAGERLLAFVRAAEHDVDFAAKLPDFFARVRQLFTQGALRDYVEGVRRVEPHGHILHYKEALKGLETSYPPKVQRCSGDAEIRTLSGRGSALAVQVAGWSRLRDCDRVDAKQG